MQMFTGRSGTGLRAAFGSEYSASCLRRFDRKAYAVSAPGGIRALTIGATRRIPDPVAPLRDNPVAPRRDNPVAPLRDGVRLPTPNSRAAGSLTLATVCLGYFMASWGMGPVASIL